MALWKARSLTPEQKVRIVEEESENKMLDTAESGLFVGIEDVNMSDVYSSTLVISVSVLHLNVFMLYLCICICAFLILQIVQTR